jgi:hypothetical protein
MNEGAAGGRSPIITILPYALNNLLYAKHSRSILIIDIPRVKRRTSTFDANLHTHQALWARCANV